VPSNKRQHFVPRFLLKRFGHENRKQIDVFLLKTAERRNGVSIKHQCQGSYFYGTDLRIEVGLRGLEEFAAEITANVSKARFPPLRLSEAHIGLVTFIASMIGRTQHAVDVFEDMTDKLVKTIFAGDKELAPYFPHVRIGFDGAAREATAIHVTHAPYCFDLDIKVLNNNTRLPFVISDNPAVTYNMWLEHLTYRSNTGLHARGLQIFLPLNPNHVVLLYDQEIYKVGSRKSSWIEDMNEADVRAVNDLQWLNASKCVFIPPSTPYGEIRRLAETNTRRRRNQLSIVREFKQPPTEEGSRRSLIMTTRPDIRAWLSLSFIKKKIQPTPEDINRGAPPHRDSGIDEVFQIASGERRKKASGEGSVDYRAGAAAVIDYLKRR